MLIVFLIVDCLSRKMDKVMVSKLLLQLTLKPHVATDTVYLIDLVFLMFLACLIANSRDESANDSKILISTTRCDPTLTLTPCIAYISWVAS